MTRQLVCKETLTTLLLGCILILGLAGCKRRVRFVRHRVPPNVTQEDRREILMPRRSVKPGKAPLTRRR